MNDIRELTSRVLENVERVIVGKRNTIVLALSALYAGGHILLEDVPGVAKTMLARALAKSFDCSFNRIQCTPDLLPTDVTGASVFNPRTSQFQFRPGPIFAQIVLSDEINRATPRTQSAFLEAMAEHQVTVDGHTRALAEPFMIIATQNPIEHEGTYPLPEAQLDRSLMKISLGYPDRQDEDIMLQRMKRSHPIDTLEPVATADEVLAARKIIRDVHVAPAVRAYLLDIVAATRSEENLDLGASPRASLWLARSAQALAAVQGRAYVLPDDIKRLAPAVLSHRVILKPESRLRRITVARVLKEILDSLPVPLEEEAQET